jgi:hypothetical protein
MALLETSMIFLGGSKRSFRCEAESKEGPRTVKCGSNCFHHPEPDDKELWECNSCGAHYRSD